MKIEQWDIVRFRINAADRDLHPGVVISAPEWCADERKLRLNVLACSKRPPADGAKTHQIVLNGSDGLDFACIWQGCTKPRIKGKFGSVYCVDHLYAIGARE